MSKRVEVMDTTLRDGEQTSGVSYTPSEKLSIATFILEKLNVNRIEVASAHVSEGEFEAVRKINQWAGEKGYKDQIEVLGFVDHTRSVDWIDKTGGKVLNLLSKGSLNHLTYQLKKTPEQHIKAIQETAQYAQSKGIQVNVYLEDWSNGMLHSKDYVHQITSELSNLPISRVMLPDTLGILHPEETYSFVCEMVEAFPNIHFDFHAHNDYDLAVANVMQAVKAGVRGVHLTVNGLGERTGNAPLASSIVALKDHLNVHTTVRENKIYWAGKLVETFSGIRIPQNKPVVGENVFTQTAGIHADGDQKKNLYFNDLLPERFGQRRKYALGKTSGKANIAKNLEEFGIILNSDDLKKVTQRVIEIGDKKGQVTTEDLPYIVSDVLRSDLVDKKIFIENYSFSLANNLRPSVSLKLNIDGETHEKSATGDGLYDAFMNALKKIYKEVDKKLPQLLDYQVTIPPGGKTNALVETKIKWQYNGKEIRSKSLDPDQTVAAIKATLKILNLIESNFETIQKIKEKITVH